MSMVNASAMFQRVINHIIHGLAGTATYIDDLVVAADTWEEHLQCLRFLFTCLNEAGLTLNLAKPRFIQSFMLGIQHIIGVDNILVDSLSRAPQSPGPEIPLPNASSSPQSLVFVSASLRPSLGQPPCHLTCLDLTHLVVKVHEVLFRGDGRAVQSKSRQLRLDFLSTTFELYLLSLLYLGG
ncbi:hypothetical protein O3P69_001742 [Scylla paramamosain]|uniref:Reverse transcriptase domain-containing protein n=1 Tax=Scylla paramamosain TaxID=85552 RepID=A0AAW0UZ71_SCYPA